MYTKPFPFPSPPLLSPLRPLPSPPLPSPPFPPTSPPLHLQLEAAQKRCAILCQSVEQVNCDSDVSEFVTATSKTDEFWPPLIVYATPEQSEVGHGDSPFGRAYPLGHSSLHLTLTRVHCSSSAVVCVCGGGVLYVMSEPFRSGSHHYSFDRLLG